MGIIGGAGALRGGVFAVLPPPPRAAISLLNEGVGLQAIHGVIRRRGDTLFKRMVRIVQCLCPSRHCILAFAYQPDRTTGPKNPDEPSDAGEVTLTEENASDYMRSMGDGLVKAGKVNRLCDLCGSEELWYEDKPTRFDDIEQAYRVMKEVEAAQMATREFLKASKN
jgi:hypothetical protein